MSGQTVFTLIVVLLLLAWLAQLVLLFVNAQNQGRDPFRIVSGAAVFFPIPLVIAEVAPGAVDSLANFWDSLVGSLFGGSRSSGQSAPPAPTAYGGGGGRQPAAGVNEYAARLLLDGQELPLTLPRTRLGRYPNNDVVIENTTVSAYHAEIIRRPDSQHEIVDRESRNGTRVNGALIRSQVLKDGDLITLGGATLHYLQSPLPIERSAPPPYEDLSQPEFQTDDPNTEFRPPSSDRPRYQGE